MKFYLAPMEGITGYIFRNAVEAQFGCGVDKYFTPFIEPHINKGCMTHREKNDVLPEHNRGMNIVPQILTNSAEAFLLAEKHLTDLGYRELNINLGCPSPTVTTKYRGSGLLRDTARLDEMLAEIFEKTSCEVSVKTRIGYSDPIEWQDILGIYNKYPLKELIIHPRVREEFYGGNVHTDAFIYALKNSRHQLCYNGDIRNTEDYDNVMRILSESCGTRLPDAIMSGRGMVEDPSLLMRLKAHADAVSDKSKANKTASSGPASEDSSEHNAASGSIVGGSDAVKAHAGSCRAVSADKISAEEIRIFTDRLAAGYGELLSGDTPVLHKMKEVWSWLINGFPDQDRLLKRIVKAKKMSDYKAAVDAALKAYH